MVWVAHHGEEHSAHRAAPPAAEMGPQWETDGLSTFHVSLTQALHFKGIPDPTAPAWVVSLQ